jgi:hypothetical protein
MHVAKFHDAIVPKNNMLPLSGGMKSKHAVLQEKRQTVNAQGSNAPAGALPTGHVQSTPRNCTEGVHDAYDHSQGKTPACHRNWDFHDGIRLDGAINFTRSTAARRHTGSAHYSEVRHATGDPAGHERRRHGSERQQL